MVVREIVKIDEEKCNGCGECVPNCVEGALQIVDGKAKLVNDSHCDGLGACLGTCPQDAISIVEREADEFDEEVVGEHVAQEHEEPTRTCPGLALQNFGGAAADATAEPDGEPEAESALTQWPVQLELVPAGADFLDAADLLLAADCVPFAMADFHARFLGGRKLLVGCPKLDDAAHYADKLTQILRQHDLRSLTVVHMEVPCCHGLVAVMRKALQESGSDVPVEEVVIGIRGTVKERRQLAGSAAARR